MEVSKEEWALWRDHPVTQALWVMLQRLLQEEEQHQLELFRQRAYLSEDPAKMQVGMALATGACETYRYLLSMDEEDVNP